MNKHIIIPGSKSYIQRALIVGACCNGISRIKKLNLCDDVISTIDLLRQLGANIIVDKEKKIAIIEKPIDFSIEEKELFVGESGTLCRIIIPILCNCFNGKFTINGSKTILNRVMEDSIFDIFRSNGIIITTSNDKLPITIDTTNRKSFNKEELYILDGSKTSQYISGFIISFVLANRRNKHITNIQIENCSSIGYVRITLGVLNSFHWYCDVKYITSDSVYISVIGRTKLSPNYDYESPVDWSSGAAILTAAHIFNKNITIDNLQQMSPQPDAAISNILHNIKYKYNEVPIDISKSPDIFPYVAAATAISKIKFTISGIHVLRNKESDRAQVIVDEFNNLGINCHIENDNFIIENYNGPDLKKIGNDVDYHGDHRIAMALIMIKAYYNQEFKNDNCINKSYPDFIKDLNMIIYEK